MAIKMKKSKRLKAFTLIEVIIAMAIFGIILIAFLNMFSFAMIGLYRAGDKSTATNLVQSDFENQLAAGEAYYSDVMELNFEGKIIEITGGFIDTTKSSGLSSSKVKGFIPFIPTIIIDPIVLVEGFKTPLVVNVTGFDTSFNSSTRIEIWDKEFTNKLYDYNNFIRPSDVIGTPIKEDETEGTFEINNNFLNANVDYIIRIVTDLSGGRQEISRAKLTIAMPMLVAVSDQSVYVSENGDNWFKRSSIASFPTVNNLKDIIYAKGEYMTVGGSSLLRVKDFKSWENVYSGVSGMSGISYSEGNYYVSTENGSIYQSTNGNTWTTLYPTSSYKFNDIHSTGDGKVIVVGEGVIVTVMKDIDGSVSQSISEFTGIEFKGITSNSTKLDDDSTWTHEFIAIGSGGNVYGSNDGINWGEIYSGGADLNDIYFAGNSIGYTGNPWLAVGDSGRLSTFNLVGTKSEFLISASNLNSVVVSQKRIFAVGEDGIILRSAENNPTFTLIDLGTDKFESITGR